MRDIEPTNHCAATTEPEHTFQQIRPEHAE